MAKPWHIPKRPFWQLPNLSNSPPPSTVTSQSLAKPCPEGRLGGEQYEISKKSQGPNRGIVLASDLPIHSSTHPFFHSPNQKGVHDSSCCLGSLLPYGTVPGRSLHTLRWSSCAPLIPTAHSTVQLSPLFSAKNRHRPRKDRDQQKEAQVLG